MTLFIENSLAVSSQEVHTLQRGVYSQLWPSSAFWLYSASEVFQGKKKRKKKDKNQKS